MKLFAALVAAALTTTTFNAQAQTYPDRAIKVIVPFAAGGAVDSLARVIGAPGLYIRWARAMLGLYQGLAYYRGRWGAAFKRLGL